MITALFAALTGATAMILDKEIISKERVNFLTYMVLTMVFLFLLTALLLPFYGAIDLNNFELVYLISFFSVVGIAYLYNFLYFYSINHEKVSDVEPLAMLYPLVATVLAATFYSSERNIYVLLFALLAALTLIFSRIEKKHLNINKYSLAMLGFVLLMAIESLFVKRLLEAMTPVALYGLRTGVLALLFIIFLKPKLKGIGGKKYLHIIMASATVVAHYVLMYYSISNLGLVMTNLVFILVPVLILFGSKFILKEKLEKKKIISSIIILFCIAGAVIFGGNG